MDSELAAPDGAAVAARPNHFCVLSAGGPLLALRGWQCECHSGQQRVHAAVRPHALDSCTGPRCHPVLLHTVPSAVPSAFEQAEGARRSAMGGGEVASGEQLAALHREFLAWQAVIRTQSHRMQAQHKQPQARSQPHLEQPPSLRLPSVRVGVLHGASHAPHSPCIVVDIFEAVSGPAAGAACPPAPLLCTLAEWAHAHMAERQALLSLLRSRTTPAYSLRAMSNQGTVPPSADRACSPPFALLGASAPTPSATLPALDRHAVVLSWLAYVTRVLTLVSSLCTALSTAHAVGLSTAAYARPICSWNWQQTEPTRKTERELGHQRHECTSYRCSRRR